MEILGAAETRGGCRRGRGGAKRSEGRYNPALLPVGDNNTEAVGMQFVAWSLTGDWSAIFLVYICWCSGDSLSPPLSGVRRRVKKRWGRIRKSGGILRVIGCLIVMWKRGCHVPHTSSLFPWPTITFLVAFSYLLTWSCYVQLPTPCSCTNFLHFSGWNFYSTIVSPWIKI